MQHCLSTFALASSGGLMLWSEKTTVCRIFSCQRSDGGSTPKPSARSLAGPDAPLRFLAESPLTVAVSESVNVGSIGALVLSSAWLAEAAPPHLAVQGGETTASTISPTSVGARLKSLTRSPKLFQRSARLHPFGFRRGNRRPYPRAKVGGEYRARTGDLLVANQALSQLS